MALGSVDKKKQSDGTAQRRASPASRRGGSSARFGTVVRPVGVGFALGGVEPGRLHAKGKCVEVHKLFYSIGRAGRYLLHIGLRHQSQPLPGCP